MQRNWHAADGRKYLRVRDQGKYLVPEAVREFILNAGATDLIDFLLTPIAVPAVTRGR